MSSPPASQKCPGCPALYNTSKLKVGQRFKCVKCQAIVVVGGSPVSAAPSASGATAPPAGNASGVGPAPPRENASGIAPARPRGNASGIGPAGGGGLFSVAGGDDEVRLDDDNAEDLASALVASASRQGPAHNPTMPGAGAAPAPKGSTAPPFQIPGYQVGEAIGQGGMATVYKGIQISLKRPVAVKVLDANLAQDAAGLARFQKEAAVLSSMSHAGIVGIIDGGNVGGRPYLVMEYVPGTNLRYLLKNVRVPMDKLIGYLVQILAALHYAHGKGVVHRDVKPENVVIGKDQIVKLADFGVAGLTKNALGPDGAPMGMTGTSTALGTAAYAAPEQLKDARTAGPQADLYSVGVMLYEILTGELPMGAFEPPSALNPNVPPGLDMVVLKALKRDATQRFANAVEMSEALQAALAGAPAAGAQAPAPAAAGAGAPPPAPSAPAGGLAGLVGSIPGPSLPPPGPPPPPSPARPNTSGGSGRLSAEAEEALKKEHQRKQEAAMWQAWKDGQGQAQDGKEESKARVKARDKEKERAPAAGQNLKAEVQKQIATEQKKKDEQFRKEWDAKQALARKREPSKLLKQLPGILLAAFGLLVVIALLDLHSSLPFLRQIPGLVPAAAKLRSLAGM